MAFKIKKILITQEQLEAKIKELGKQISEEYAHRRPILVGLLKGSVPFMARLMSSIDCEIETQYMAISSYEGGITSLGKIRIIKDLDVPIEGRDIIIVEDIVDTGLTLDTIVRLLKSRLARSVEVACLLDKRTKRVKDVDIKYIGFDIPDEFVVGFGLDYNELLRNLPYVGVLDTEELKEA